MVKHCLPVGLLCGFALVAAVATQASGESPRSISFENGLNALVDDTKGNAGDSITFMKEGKETELLSAGVIRVCLFFVTFQKFTSKEKRHSYFVTEWAAGTHGFRIPRFSIHRSRRIANSSLSMRPTSSNMKLSVGASRSRSRKAKK